MTKLEPGRELDKLIAEQVMGLKDVGWRDGEVMGIPHRFLEHGDASGGYPSGSVPYYSTWIEAAWGVVESLLPHFDFDLDCFVREEEPIFVASFNDTLQGNGDTAPHAICLASLKAVGYDPE